MAEHKPTPPDKPQEAPESHESGSEVEVPPRPPGGRYGDAEIERGLTALALSSGNSRRASELLKLGGVSIPHTTLDHWKYRSQVDLYERVKADNLPRLRAKLADQLEALAQDQLALEAEITARVRERLDEIPDRDLPGALRNVAVSAGIALDKSAPIRGEPNLIVAAADRYREAITGLDRLGLIVEGDATEIPLEGERTDDED